MRPTFLFSLVLLASCSEPDFTPDAEYATSLEDEQQVTDSVASRVLARQRALDAALASDPPNARQYLQDSFHVWDDADSAAVDWEQPPLFGHDSMTLRLLAARLKAREWVDTSFEVIPYRGGPVAVAVFRDGELPRLTVWENDGGVWRARAMLIHTSGASLRHARGNAEHSGEAR